MINVKREFEKTFFCRLLLEGKTHVIEIFSSLFFKLGTSCYIPFILSYLDSLRNAVLLTMRDPKALVDCPLELEGAHGATTCVLLNILHLQYSDTKCQLWYFLHLGY